MPPRSLGPQTYGWAQVQNIKRDPFEQAVGEEQKSVLSIGGALASPSTAYIYNWNMLPVGQQLWLKELESYVDVPAAAGSGELQPQSGAGAGQEDGGEEPEPVKNRTQQRAASSARDVRRVAAAPVLCPPHD